MKENSILKDLLQEFSKLLSPLVYALEYKFPRGLNNYLRSIDIGFDELLARTDDESFNHLFYESFEELVVAYHRLAQILTIESAEVENLADAALLIKSIFDKLSLLNDQIPTLSDPNNEATNIGLSICEDLLHKYLRKNQWKLLEVLKIFNICKVEEGRLKWYWENVNHIFNDPFRLFLEKYNWEQENYQVISLLLDVEGFLKSVNLYPYFISPSGSHIELSESLEGDTGALNEKQLRIPLLKAKQNGHFQEVGVALQPTHSSLSIYKLYVFLYGIAHLSEEFKINGNSKLSFVTDFSSSDQIAIGISEEGMAIKPSGEIAGSDFELGFKVEIDQSDEKKKIFSNVLGAALQHGGVSLSLQISISDGELDLMLNTIIRDIEFQINNQFTDGFLSRILPDRGLNPTFDLNVGWSKKQGLHVNNLPGLKAEIPISSSRNSTSVNLSIEAPSNRMVNAIITVDYFANIGPLGVRIDKVGLKSALSLLDSVSGNLGYLNADFRLNTPSGIALSLKTQNFSGAGYLARQNTRYTGALQLHFNKLNLTAFGILDTELPDGREGYSLLILIMADGFKPIPLGLGFTLTGIGGLLAMNRSMDLDAVRADIKKPSLDKVLFPEVKPKSGPNAAPEPPEIGAELISFLDRAFPVTEDRFVFGPMAKIKWGSPKPVLQIKMALLIELFPLRIGIAGVLASILPSEDSNTLSLKVNFVGELDFQKKIIAFDAAIFDSRIMQFTLSGMMAFRLHWGERPAFLLSLGGFHPKAPAPPVPVGKLDRVRMDLVNEEDAEVYLESYFAITSNTVQVGAKLDAEFKALEYKAIARVQFDVLFQFNPFRFYLNASLSAGVFKDGEEKLAISIEFALEGPAPWYVTGKAVFEILEIEIPINVELTFGQEKETETLPDVDVRKLLKPALADTSNWTSYNLPGEIDLVKINVPEESDELILTPQSGIRIQQGIVPLNERIEKFGNAQPKGGNYFEIRRIEIGGHPIEPGEEDYLEDYFAPNNFFELSDGEKLTRPSFDRYNSGIQFDALGIDGGAICGEKQEKELTYEEITIDEENMARRYIQVDPVHFEHLVVGSSTATSTWSQQRRMRSGRTPIQRKKPQHKIVRKKDLSDASASFRMAGRQSARKLNEFLRQDAKLQGEYRVVAEHETVVVKIAERPTVAPLIIPKKKGKKKPRKKN